MISTDTIKYISSDLKIIERSGEIPSNSRLIIDNIVYVALTPEVYIWLRQRMEKAHLAFQSGKLAEESWNVLRKRFYPIHDWIIETWGEDVIAKSLNISPGNPYIVADMGDNGHSPANKDSLGKSDYRYPVKGEYPLAHPVSSEAIAKVNGIRDKALSLGWTETGLYQNRGKFKWPCGQDYGLVCFLGNGESIGEVTRQSIEIIIPSGVRHRFYNRDVDQPWIKKRTEGE